MTYSTQFDMADVFMAYGCKAAIHLDMYRPQFSYFALSKLKPSTETSAFNGYKLERLVNAMDAGDKQITMNGKEYNVLPYLGSFYRDFFYVTKKRKQ